MGSSARKVLTVVLVFLAVHGPDLGFALNEEGRTLLELGEKDGEVDPCAWNDIACEDEKIISSYRGNVIRRLQVERLVPSGQDGADTGGSRMPPLSPSGEVEDSPKDNPQRSPPHPVSSPPPPPHLSPPPPPPPPPPPSFTPFLPPPSQKKGRGTLIYISVGAAAGLLFLAFAIFALFCMKKVLVKPWTSSLSRQLQKAFVAGLPKLKRSELEIACEDFSNIVGTLADGTLYKGTLSNGVEIGVSIIKTNDWLEPMQKQFRKKIATLSKVNHKNFVNIVGYCEDENPLDRMLVFEYAPNGKLYEHLHNIESHIYLNWTARTRVAMGVAYCLDHLHRLSPPIILGKLDSSSVYLTDDFAAKVADLELWSKTSELGTSSSEVVHCPENVVYLFGTLLLELISGRPPYLEENGILIFWAAKYLDGMKPFKDVIDPALGSVAQEQIEALFNVVKACLNPDPMQRPTMETVVEMLKGITSVNPEAAAPRLSPVWWAELEIISRDTV